jgi:hypothetical protein
MKRRKVLVGLGSLAAGAAAATGTGALDSVLADRDVDLRIAPDGNAYLGLSPSSSYASTDSINTLELDFTSNPNGGEGINNRADSVFEDVFTLTNQSTDDLWVWCGFTTPSGASVPYNSGAARSVELIGDGEKIAQPKDFSFPRSSLDDKDNYSETSRSLDMYEPTGPIKLSPGASTPVEIRFLVYGSGSARDTPFRIVFRAETSPPSSTSDYNPTANGDPS